MMTFSHVLRSLAFAAVAALPLQAGAAIVTHSFNLNGAQEVPPNGSPAAGSAEVTIDDLLGSITFFAAVFNLDGAPFAVHLHGAPVGVDGAVVYDLGAVVDSAGPVTIGTFEVPSSLAFAGVSKPIDGSLAAAINSSPFLFYMNLHTDVFPGGEVRGQLAVAPIPVPAALWLLAPALGLLMRRRAQA